MVSLVDKFVSGLVCFFVFFFNDTATTEIYTLSLHDALPISCISTAGCCCASTTRAVSARYLDRKSTRLNSSHGYISYAVFFLKKKNKNKDSNDLCLLHQNSTYPTPQTTHS